MSGHKAVTQWIRERDTKNLPSYTELEVLLSASQARDAELQRENAELKRKLEAGWIKVCDSGLKAAHAENAELRKLLEESKRCECDCKEECHADGKCNCYCSSDQMMRYVRKLLEAKVPSSVVSGARVGAG